MTLHADWYVRSRPISFDEACDKSRLSPPRLKQLYRDGVFGPAPTSVSEVPFHEAAAMFVIKTAEDLHLPDERLLPVLPVVAGAAYVKYQVTEIAEGRCPHVGGTHLLNIKLGNLLRSPKAHAELEARLPGGPIETKRYACFGATNSFTCDDLNEIDQPAEELRIIDAWDVARSMKQAFGGERIFAHIP
jgi:hypothetical protein